MLRKSVLLILVTAGALLADSDGDRPRRRVRLGGVTVGAGYVHGPAWSPGWGPGWYGYGPAYGSLYSPFWYSPWIHPGLWNGFSQGPSMGQIKLSAAKSAVVYLDGAYAGPADKLKSIWLEPGAYNIEVRDFSGSKFERRVYVLSGKTLDIQTELKNQTEVRP